MICLFSLLLTACGVGGFLVTPTVPSTQEGTETTVPVIVPTGLTLPMETETAPKDPLPELERTVLDMIHAMRSEKKLPGLTEESLLSELAYLRAAEAREVFDHVRPDGRDWNTVLGEHDYTASDSGEAIHRSEEGYPAADILRDWLSSKVASVVLTNPAFTHVGVGVRRQNGYCYVVCILTAK